MKTLEINLQKGLNTFGYKPFLIERSHYLAWSTQGGSIEYQVDESLDKTDFEFEGNQVKKLKGRFLFQLELSSLINHYKINATKQYFKSGRYNLTILNQRSEDEVSQEIEVNKGKKFIIFQLKWIFSLLT